MVYRNSGLLPKRPASSPNARRGFGLKPGGLDCASAASRTGSQNDLHPRRASSRIGAAMVTPDAHGPSAAAASANPQGSRVENASAPEHYIEFLGVSKSFDD